MKRSHDCYCSGNNSTKMARIAFAVRACQRLRRPPLRSGPPGDPHGPRRLSKPGGLAFTPGPPPGMAAPGERGRVQGRSGGAGAAGSWRRRHGWGPVLVRAGDGRRPPSVRAAAPGDGAGSVACAHRPITPLMPPSPRPRPALPPERSFTNIEQEMPAVHPPIRTTHQGCVG